MHAGSGRGRSRGPGGFVLDGAREKRSTTTSDIGGDVVGRLVKLALRVDSELAER